jgi:hypothetical protein
MTQSSTRKEETKKSRLSLDSWAVILAFLAALLIRTGVIPRVNW